MVMLLAAEEERMRRDVRRDRVVGATARRRDCGGRGSGKRAEREWTEGFRSGGWTKEKQSIVVLGTEMVDKTAMKGKNLKEL